MAITLVPEDGTGREDANVYDDEVETERVLTEEEGLTAYSRLATVEMKRRVLLRVTRFVERDSADRVDGALVNPDQGLLFPRVGATGRDRYGFESDERPLDYRRGIMLLADDEAQALQQGRRVTRQYDANLFFQVRKEGVGILQRNRAWQIDWKDVHLDAFELVRTAYPAGRRNLRA